MSALETSQKTGRFIGVGVGPGDPELITLKALRLIQRASVVSYLANDEGGSQAKTIASEAFAGVTHAQNEIAIVMPMSTDRSLANEAYDNGAKAIANELSQGKDVVFLCEGDPLFFGSFAYLLERLRRRVSMPSRARCVIYQRRIVRLESSVNRVERILRRGQWSSYCTAN